jgi:hypothetical protein
MTVSGLPSPWKMKNGQGLATSGSRCPFLVTRNAEGEVPSAPSRLAEASLRFRRKCFSANREIWMWNAVPLRPAILLTAGLLIVAATLVAAVYFWLPQANLRVATGPPGITAYRFITAFASVTEATHPRIHIKLVQVADLAASAKAIEDHATDLGIVRGDAVIPTNGATIAILRRDVVAFVVPAKSPIDEVSALAGRTIGIPQGSLQTYNEQTDSELLQYSGEHPKAGLPAARRNRGGGS